MRQRWGNGRSVGQSEHTFIQLAYSRLVWAWLAAPQRSLATGYCNKYNHEKLEILRELSKCDIQTLSEQTLEKCP